MPNSPACGTVWNIQRSSPVRTSNALTGARTASLVMNVSVIDWPITTTSPTTSGAPVQR